jgi:hypothetical protein
VHLVGLSIKTNKGSTQHTMTERQDQHPKQQFVVNGSN